MEYGEPAHAALAAASALVKLTLVPVSPLTRPLELNSVPAKVTAWPYVFDELLAVMSRVLALRSEERRVGMVAWLWRPVQTAALAIMENGEPASAGLAAAQGLVKLTL